MVKAENFIKIVVLIMIIYSSGMTLFIHSLPANTLAQLSPFEQPATNYPKEDIDAYVDRTYNLARGGIPIINVGALVFYTGNFFLDFLVNFLTAIPQMFILLLNVVTLFGFKIDGVVLLVIQSTATVAFGIYTAIALIELMINIRSGRQIGGII